MVRLLKVKTLDFWAFGGLRNFQAGVETFRRSLFPPDVMKFFHLVDLNKVSVCGVLLEQNSTLYFPVPADLTRPRKKKEGNLEVSLLKRAEGVTDLSFECLPIAKKGKKVETASGFLAFERVREYFLKVESFTAPVKALKSLSDFVKEEIKVGLTLNKDFFTAQEGRLYANFVLRPGKDEKNETHLVALLKEKGDFSFEEGFYYFGGEARVSYARVEQNEELNGFLEEKVKVEKGNLYRFYLLSHAFVNGELEPGKELVVGDLKFKLVWSFSAGGEWISGYEKPGAFMLKPGSVFLLEAKEEGELSRLSPISGRARLPRRHGSLEEVELSNYGWNWGILGDYLREVEGCEATK